MKYNYRNFLSFAFVAIIYILGIILAIIKGVPLTCVAQNYQFNIIIILIAMELFTNLISSTNIVESLALKLSVFSRGMRRRILIFFAILMFFVSAFLNNITAVLIVLPIILVVMKSIGVNQKYINIFFACLLASSNTGGAASPIGDFPAIVIMNSGIVSFKDYLFNAFPFFLITTLIIVVRWVIFVDDDRSLKDKNMLAIDLLKSKHKNLKVKKDILIGLLVIFGFMFACWSIIPSSIVPGEIIAIVGCIIGIFYCSLKGIKVSLLVDFKPIITIGAFLFLATVISQTGILNNLAIYLQKSVSNPKILLIEIMLLTSLVSGLFGAGPAASAMMPVVAYLCGNVFLDCSNWVAIAYAAAICAGSSLFMWSATAGFILSKNINSANLIDKDEKIRWGIKNYIIYGFQNYLLQMGVTIIMILIVLK